MTLHETAFDYLKPTDEQMGKMNSVRAAYAGLAHLLKHHLPDGADKTHVFRLLRTAAMWSNIAITRGDDGGPRQ